MDYRRPHRFLIGNVLVGFERAFWLQPVLPHPPGRKLNGTPIYAVRLAGDGRG